MAGTVKISNLTNGTPTAAAVIPYSVGGTTFGGSIAAMRNAIDGAGTTLGQVRTITASGQSSYIDRDAGFGFILSSGVLAAGYGGHIRAPYDFQIEAVYLGGTNNGNATIDVYAGTTLPLGTANSIVGTNYPALAGTSQGTLSTFTGWSRATINKGEWIGVQITGAGTIGGVSASFDVRCIATA